MKPRTKLEREVTKLSHSLCPRKREIRKAIKTLEKEGAGRYYHVIAEVKGDFQVFRFFKISIYKRKKPTSWETQQLWYGRGSEILIARQKTMGIYYDTYIKDSELEIRHNYRNFAYNSANDMPISTMDYVSLLPIFDKQELEDICRLSSIAKRQMLRTASEYMETLYNQHRDIFMRLCDKEKSRDIVKYQGEIKVAVRHHYKFEDVSMWFDTIKMARHFKIETRNPYYCAPKDLNMLHQRLLKKWNKEMAEKEVEKLVQYEPAYYNHIKPYIGLVFKSANIVIVPLMSVKEVYFEGKMMHHCVYKCEYWKKKDVLLLSARVGEKHVETIEFSLNDFKVRQSRGLENQPSQYHAEILSLMQKGKKEIKSLMKKAA